MTRDFVLTIKGVFSNATALEQANALCQKAADLLDADGRAQVFGWDLKLAPKDGGLPEVEEVSR